MPRPLTILALLLAGAVSGAAGTGALGRAARACDVSDFDSRILNSDAHPYRVELVSERDRRFAREFLSRLDRLRSEPRDGQARIRVGALELVPGEKLTRDGWNASVAFATVDYRYVLKIYLDPRTYRSHYGREHWLTRVYAEAGLPVVSIVAHDGASQALAKPYLPGTNAAVGELVVELPGGETLMPEPRTLRELHHLTRQLMAEIRQVHRDEEIQAKLDADRPENLRYVIYPDAIEVVIVDP